MSTLYNKIFKKNEQFFIVNLTFRLNMIYLLIFTKTLFNLFRCSNYCAPKSFLVISVTSTCIINFCLKFCRKFLDMFIFLKRSIIWITNSITNAKRAIIQKFFWLTMIRLWLWLDDDKNMEHRLTLWIKRHWNYLKIVVGIH